MFVINSDDKNYEIYNSAAFWIILLSCWAVCAIIGIWLIRTHKIGSKWRRLGWYLCLGFIGWVISSEESEKRIKKLEEEKKEKEMGKSKLEEKYQHKNNKEQK